MKYFYDHSINYGVIPSEDHETCDNLWRNVLFIDNFSPYSERVSFLKFEIFNGVFNLLKIVFSCMNGDAWYFFYSYEDFKMYQAPPFRLTHN
jgi:hypothetical protein